MPLSARFSEIAAKFWPPAQLVVTFRCAPGLSGVLAPPVPAGDILPGWYKKLPATHSDLATIQDAALTVKRCLPFRDALRLGWILRLSADVRFEVSQDGKTVTDQHRMPFTMIESHHPKQVAGSSWDRLMPLKFNIQWVVTTPPGWSMLYQPLLNRDNDQFEVASGVVDTDRYHNEINLPFVFKAAMHGKLFTLPKGTPLAQMIPIRRQRFRMDVRASTTDETRETTRQQLLLGSMAGWYRKVARAVR